MKYCIPFLFLTCGLIAQSNNVGINITSPTGQLEVHDTQHSKVVISSDGYFSDSVSLIMRNMTSGSTGTEFILESKREDGLLFRSNSDVSSNTSPSILMLKPDGQVGIGTSTPAAQMHIVGSGSQGQLLVGPNVAPSGGDSELFLSESNGVAYGMKLHYDGLLNRLEFRGVSNSVESGPHLTISRDNGAVVLPHLAGSGNRALLASSSGQLIEGPPVPVHIYAINSAQFQCGFDDGSSGYRSSSTQARGRHQGKLCPGFTLYAALQLMHGDEISQMTAYFTDESSAKNVRIKILRRDHNSLNPISIWTIESSGSSASLRSVTGNFNTHVVNNDLGSYFIELSCIHDGSGSLAEWPSTSNPLWLHSVKLK